MTSGNQLACHISILTEAMPSRDSVEVLVSVFVGLVRDLLEVCFPYRVTVPVEDFEVAIKGGVQDREILVNPRKRLFSKRDVEGGIARFGGPRRVDRYLIE